MPVTEATVSVTDSVLAEVETSAAIRTDRVRRARRLIELGLLDTPERLDRALDGLAEDLGLSAPPRR